MRPILLLCCLSTILGAQPTQDPSALYFFESNLGDAIGDAGNLGVPQGVVDYDCGVDGQAALLSTQGDFIRIPGGASNNINREFDDENLTLSFYFKSLDVAGTQVLLSKRDTLCGNPNQLLITYEANSRTLTARMADVANSVTLTHDIDNGSCWQQVALVRDLTAVRLYLNGERVDEGATPDRIDIDNDGDLLIGASACPDTDGATFQGLIDELRIYGGPLADGEIASLYGSPDRILTPPTQLFLGESVTVDLNSNCGTTFTWNPTTGVETFVIAEPTITPTEAGSFTYRVEITDDQTSCVATDELEIDVIDPDDLECNQVFLPRAFTPNDIGPAENETFGIVNPFAIPDLASFEIYDRHGALVFRTSDAFEQWDGNFNGQPVNPGPMLWRVVYNCEEEEIVRTGSVTILR